MEEWSSSLAAWPCSPYTPVPPAPVPCTLKRPALNAITNQPSKCAIQWSAPVPLASVFEVSASFRPAYQTCTTHTRIQDVGGENVPVVGIFWSEPSSIANCYCFDTLVHCCIVIVICMLLPAQKCHSAAWSDIYRFEQMQIVSSVLHR